MTIQIECFYKNLNDPSDMQIDNEELFSQIGDVYEAAQNLRLQLFEFYDQYYQECFLSAPSFILLQNLLKRVRNKHMMPFITTEHYKHVVSVDINNIYK